MLSFIQMAVNGINQHDVVEFLTNNALTLLFASGNNATFRGQHISHIGLLWFLVVLFCSKALYDVLQLILKKKPLPLQIVIFVLSFIGVYIGQKTVLPFSFDLTLTVPVILCIVHFARGRFDPEKTQ